METPFMDALNRVLSGEKGTLKEYLKTSIKENVDKEIKRYTSIIDTIAKTNLEIMMETLDYLVHHPDSKLFEIVMPKMLNSNTFLYCKELPQNAVVLIEKALERKYYDKYFVTAKFFNMLSTEGKIRALKFLATHRKPQYFFARLFSGRNRKTLHIEYNVLNKIGIDVIDRLHQSLSRFTFEDELFFTFDEESLKALTLHALSTGSESIKKYIGGQHEEKSQKM